MTAHAKAALLIGSPKGSQSNSLSIGAYLASRLKTCGIDTTEFFVHQSLRSQPAIDSLLVAACSADILIVSFPLYVDCLPAGLIQGLDIIAARRCMEPPLKKPLFLAVCNSGFPEPQHSHVAIEICRSFARKAAFTWAGGLPIGGGAAIRGRPLDRAGGMFSNIRAALDLTAKSLADGGNVPRKALTLLSKPPVPAWLYTFVGSLGWRLRALANKSHKYLRARPYDEQHP